MSAPNIVSITTITGKTAVLAVTTSSSAIVTNSTSSGKVFKINSLVVANVEGTTATNITVSLNRSSTDYRIVNTVSVPADASLIVISKDTSIYLEEGDSIKCLSSAANALEAICSFEEIS